MLKALVLAALTASSLSMPHVHKRDMAVVVETITDVVYVYDVVTVTASDGLVSSTTVLSPTFTTSLVLSTPIAGQSVQNHLVDLPTSMPPAIPTSQPVVSILPAPVTSTYIPPAVPTVVSSPWSISLPPASTQAVAPSPPPAALPSPPAASPSIVIPPTTYRKVTGYNELVLAHHNIHRRNHSAPDLVWDNNLAMTAYQIAISCKYAHNVDLNKKEIGGYGQNIAAGVGSDNISVVITELFYNGEVGWYNSLYDQAQPSMADFEHWGHFSQIVWRDTTKVGCWTQHCENGLSGVNNNVPPFFTVCNYQGPGNIASQYTKVGRSLNQPTIRWNYFN